MQSSKSSLAALTLGASGLRCFLTVTLPKNGTQVLLIKKLS